MRELARDERHTAPLPRPYALLLLLLAVLLSALLLGCGGRQTGTSPSTTTPIPTATPMAATATPTPTATATPTASRNLEIHHIDVEEGDAALIISPGGQVAMVDDGRWTACGNTVSYLQRLNVTRIDFHFATHYDADHIGCLDDLAAAGINVQVACYDRGGSKETQTFNDYAAACGPKRQTASKGDVITLDGGAEAPVTIRMVDLNGAGVGTSEENALSLVLKLSYGAFDHVFGGDLPGDEPDIESIVGPEVGDVEVYKVHHHGSKSSSNDNWLNAITPDVGIVSVGDNSYDHPTTEALTRLHNHRVKTYWTNTGSGVMPDPGWDRVAGTIVIAARPGLGESFTVSGQDFTDSYPNR